LLGALSASDLLDAARQRARLRREVAEVLRTVDLLALPTTSTAPAHPAREDRVHILDAEATARATRFAFLGNLTGLPAGTAPVGMADGLPVGLQLIGDAWDEATVIAGLAELERSGLGDLGRPEAWRDPAGV
jgi:aspartyl-tRNA(Asn)/glutamyl-tRNA(Gln) amidotransferase subunit A